MTMTDQPEVPAREIAEIKRDPIITTDPMEALLDTGKFEQMQRVAKAMADASLVPKHLQGHVSDCLLIVNQAIKRHMDPFDLAQVTHVVHGKLGYEGKAIAAWVNDSPRIVGSLNYSYDGEGINRRVRVGGLLVGEQAEREIFGTVEDWSTSNESWKKSPDQMLAYRGAREWARRHTPEIVLGIYTPDELEAGVGMDAKDITPKPQRADYNKPQLDAQNVVETKDGHIVKDEPEMAAPLYALISFFGEAIGNFGEAEFIPEFEKGLVAANAESVDAIRTYLDNNEVVCHLIPSEAFRKQFDYLRENSKSTVDHSQVAEER